jgi:hypothetical protein
MAECQKGVDPTAPASAGTQPYQYKNKNLKIAQKHPVKTASKKRETVVPVGLIDDEPVKRSKSSSSSSSDQERDVALQAGITVDSQGACPVRAKPNSRLGEILKDLEHQQSSYVTEIEALQKAKTSLTTANGELTEKVFELEQRLQKVVNDCLVLKGQSEVAAAEKAVLKTATDKQLKKLRDDLDKLEASKSAAPQNPKVLAELLELKAQQPVILREKTIAAEKISTLEKNLETLQHTHEELKAAYDEIKLDPVKVRAAAVRVLSLKLLEDASEKDKIHQEALGRYYQSNKPALTVEARATLMTEIGDKIRARALKEFILANPAMQAQIDEEFLTVLRKDLSLRAKYQAVLAEEIKEEMINDRVQAIVDKHQEAELVLRELEKAKSKLQNEYVKRKHDEYNDLLDKYEKLLEQNKQVAEHEERRDRSSSKDSRRH